MERIQSGSNPAIGTCATYLGSSTALGSRSLQTDIAGLWSKSPSTTTLVRVGVSNGNITDIKDDEGTFSAFGKSKKIYNLLSNINGSSNFDLTGWSNGAAPSLETILSAGVSLAYAATFGITQGVNTSILLNHAVLNNKMFPNTTAGYLGALNNVNEMYSDVYTYHSLINKVLATIRATPIKITDSVVLGTPGDTASTTGSICARLKAAGSPELGSLLYAITQVGSRGFSPVLINKIVNEYKDGTGITADIVAATKNILASDECWKTIFGSSTTSASASGSLWDQLVFLASSSAIIRISTTNYNNIKDEFDAINTLMATYKTKAGTKDAADFYTSIYGLLIPTTPPSDAMAALSSPADTDSIQEYFNQFLSGLAISETDVVNAILEKLGIIEGLIAAEIAKVGGTEEEPTEQFLNMYKYLYLLSNEIHALCSAPLYNSQNEYNQLLLVIRELNTHVDLASDFFAGFTVLVKNLWDILENGIDTFADISVEGLTLENIFPQIIMLINGILNDVKILEGNIGFFNSIAKDDLPALSSFFKTFCSGMQNVIDAAEQYVDLLQSPIKNIEIKKDFLAKKIYLLREIQTAILTVDKNINAYKDCEAAAALALPFLDIVANIEAITKRVVHELPDIHDKIFTSYNSVVQGITQKIKVDDNYSDIFSTVNEVLGAVWGDYRRSKKVTDILRYSEINAHELVEVIRHKVMQYIQKISANINTFAYNATAPPSDLWKPIDFKAQVICDFAEGVMDVLRNAAASCENNSGSDILSVTLQTAYSGLRDAFDFLQATWDSFENYYQVEACIRLPQILLCTTQAVGDLIYNNPDKAGALDIFDRWHGVLSNFLQKPEAWLSNARIAQLWMDLREIIGEGGAFVPIPPSIENLQTIAPNLIQAASLYNSIVQYIVTSFSEGLELLDCQGIAGLAEKANIYKIFWKEYADYFTNFKYMLNYHSGIQLEIRNPEQFRSDIIDTSTYWETLLKVLAEQSQTPPFIRQRLYDITAVLYKIENIVDRLIQSEQSINISYILSGIENIKRALEAGVSSETGINLDDIFKELNYWKDCYDVDPVPHAPPSIPQNENTDNVYLRRILQQITNIGDKIVHICNNTIINNYNFSMEEREAIQRISAELYGIANIEIGIEGPVNSYSQEQILIIREIQEKIKGMAAQALYLYDALYPREERHCTTAKKNIFRRCANIAKAIAQQIQEANLLDAGATVERCIVQTARILLHNARLFEAFSTDVENASLQQEMGDVLAWIEDIWAWAIALAPPDVFESIEESCNECLNLYHCLSTLSGALKQSYYTAFISGQNHKNAGIRGALSEASSVLHSLAGTIYDHEILCAESNINSPQLIAILNEISDDTDKNARLPDTCENQQKMSFARALQVTNTISYALSLIKSNLGTKSAKEVLAKSFGCLNTLLDTLRTRPTEEKIAAVGAAIYAIAQKYDDIDFAAPYFDFDYFSVPLEDYKDVYLRKYTVLLKGITAQLYDIADILEKDFDAAVNTEYKNLIVNIANSFLGADNSLPFLEDITSKYSCQKCTNQSISIQETLALQELHDITKELSFAIKQIAESISDKCCANTALYTHNILEKLLRFEDILRAAADETVMALLENQLLLQPQGHAPLDLPGISEFLDRLIRTAEVAETAEAANTIPPFKFSCTQRMGDLYLIKEILESICVLLEQHIATIFANINTNLYSINAVDSLQHISSFINDIMKDSTILYAKCPECNAFRKAEEAAILGGIREICGQIRQNIGLFVQKLLDNEACRIYTAKIINIEENITNLAIYFKQIVNLQKNGAIPALPINEYISSINSILKTIPDALSLPTVEQSIDQIESETEDLCNAIRTILLCYNIDIEPFKKDYDKIPASERVTFALTSITAKLNAIFESINDLAIYWKGEYLIYSEEIHQQLSEAHTRIHIMKTKLQDFLQNSDGLEHLSQCVFCEKPLHAHQQDLLQAIKPDALGLLAETYVEFKIKKKVEAQYKLLGPLEELAQVLQFLLDNDIIDPTNTPQIDKFVYSLADSIKKIVAQKVNGNVISSIQKITTLIKAAIWTKEPLFDVEKVTNRSFLAQITQEQYEINLAKIIEVSEDILSNFSKLCHWFAQTELAPHPIVSDLIITSGIFVQYIINAIQETDIFNGVYINIEKILKDIVSLAGQVIANNNNPPCGETVATAVRNILLKINVCVASLPETDDDIGATPSPQKQLIAEQITKISEEITNIGSYISSIDSAFQHAPAGLFRDRAESIAPMLSDINDSLPDCYNAIASCSDIIEATAWSLPSDYSSYALHAVQHEKIAVYLTKILQNMRELSNPSDGYFAILEQHIRQNMDIDQTYSKEVLDSFASLRDALLAVKAALHDLSNSQIQFCARTDSLDKYILRDIGNEMDNIVEVIEPIMADLEVRYWQGISFSFRTFLNTLKKQISSCDQITTAIQNSSANIDDFNNKKVNNAVKYISDKIATFIADFKSIEIGDDSEDYHAALLAYAQIFDAAVTFEPELKDVVTDSFYGEWEEDNTALIADPPLFSEAVLCQDIALLPLIFEEYASALSSVVTELKNNAAKVVRNGEITSSLKAIAEQIENIESQALTPFLENIYTIIDAHNNGIVTYEDWIENYTSLHQALFLLYQQVMEIHDCYDASLCCASLVLTLQDIAIALTNTANNINYIITNPLHNTLDVNTILNNIAAAFDKESLEQYFDYIQTIYDEPISPTGKCKSDYINTALRSIVAVLNGTNATISDEEVPQVHQVEELTQADVFCLLVKEVNNNIVNAINAIYLEIKNTVHFVQSYGLTTPFNSSSFSAIDNIISTLDSVVAFLDNLIDKASPFGTFCQQCIDRADANADDFNDFFEKAIDAVSNVKVTFIFLKDSLAIFCCDKKDGAALGRICSGVLSCSEFISQLTALAFQSDTDMNDALLEFAAFLDTMSAPLFSALNHPAHSAQKSINLQKVAEIFEMFNFVSGSFVEILPYTPSIAAHYWDRIIEALAAHHVDAAIINEAIISHKHVITPENLSQIQAIALRLKGLAALFATATAPQSLLHNQAAFEEKSAKIKDEINKISDDFEDIFIALSQVNDISIILDSVTLLEEAAKKVETAAKTLSPFFVEDLDFGEPADTVRNELADLVGSGPDLETTQQELHTMSEYKNNPPLTGLSNALQGIVTAMSLCADHVLAITKSDPPPVYPLARAPEVAVSLTRIYKYTLYIADAINELANTLAGHDILRFHEEIVDLLSTLIGTLDFLQNQICDVALATSLVKIPNVHECSLILYSLARGINDIKLNISRVFNIIKHKEPSYEGHFHNEIAAIIEQLSIYTELIQHSTLSQAKTFFTNFAKTSLKLKTNTDILHESIAIEKHGKATEALRKQHIKILEEITDWAQNAFGEHAIANTTVPIFEDIHTESTDIRIRNALMEIAKRFTMLSDEWLLAPYKIDYDFININQIISENISNLLYNTANIQEAIHNFSTQLKHPTCCTETATIIDQIRTQLYFCAHSFAKIIPKAQQTLAAQQDADILFALDCITAELLNISTALSGKVDDFDCLDAAYSALLSSVKNSTTVINENLLCIEGVYGIPATQSLNLKAVENIDNCAKKEVFLYKIEQTLHKIRDICETLAYYVSPPIGVPIPYKKAFEDRVHNLQTAVNTVATAFALLKSKHITCESCNPVQIFASVNDMLQWTNSLEASFCTIKDTIKALEYSMLSEAVHNILQNNLNIQKLIGLFKITEILHAPELMPVITSLFDTWNNFFEQIGEGPQECGFPALVQFLRQIDESQKAFLHYMNLEKQVEFEQLPQVVFSEQQIKEDVEALQHNKTKDDALFNTILQDAIETGVSSDIVSKIFYKAFHLSRWAKIRFTYNVTPLEKEIAETLFPSEAIIDSWQKIGLAYGHNDACQKYLDQITAISSNYEGINSVMEEIILAAQQYSLDTECSENISGYIDNIKEIFQQICENSNKIIPRMESGNYQICFTEIDKDNYILDILQAIVSDSLRIMDEMNDIKNTFTINKDPPNEYQVQPGALAKNLANLDVDFYENIQSSWQGVNTVLAEQIDAMEYIKFLLINGEVCAIRGRPTETFKADTLDLLANVADGVQSSNSAIIEYENTIYSNLTYAVKKIISLFPIFSDIKLLLFRNNNINNTKACLSLIESELSTLLTHIESIKNIQYDRRNLFLELLKVGLVVQNITDLVQQYTQDNDKEPIIIEPVEKHRGDVQFFENSLFALQNALCSVDGAITVWKGVIQSENGTKRNERCFDQEILDVLSAIIATFSGMQSTYAQGDWNWFCSAEHFVALDQVFQSMVTGISAICDLLRHPTCCVARNEYLYSILSLLEQFGFGFDGAIPYLNIDQHIFEEGEIDEAINYINKAVCSLNIASHKLGKIQLQEDAHCNAPAIAPHMKKTCRFLYRATQALCNALLLIGEKQPGTAHIVSEELFCQKVSAILDLIDAKAADIVGKLNAFTQYAEASNIYESQQNLQNSLVTLLYGVEEFQNTVARFCSVFANKVCQNCNSNTYYYDEIISSLSKTQEELFKIIQQMEDRLYKKYAKEFHEFVALVETLAQQMDLFLRIDASDARKTTVQLFANFIDNVILMYKQILRDVPAEPAASLPEKTQIIASVNKILSNSVEQLTDKLMALGVYLPPKAGYPAQTYNGQLIERDYASLIEIIKSLNNSFYIAQTTDLFNHTVVHYKWEEAAQLFREILNNIRENDMVPDPIPLKDAMEGLLNSHTEFIDVLQKTAAVPHKVDKLFDIDNSIRAINKTIAFTKNQFVKNLEEEEHSTFINTMREITSILETNFPQSITKLSNINSLNEEYVCPHRVINFAEYIGLTDIDDNLHNIYLKTNAALRAFAQDLPTYLPDDFAGPTTTVTNEVLISRINADLHTLADLIQESVNISDNYVVKDFHPESAEYFGTLAALFTDLLNSLQANYSPTECMRENKNSIEFLLADAFTAITRIPDLFIQESTILKKTCCSTFVYTLFTLLDSASILTEQIKGYDEIIDIASGETTVGALLLETVSAVSMLIDELFPQEQEENIENNGDDTSDGYCIAVEQIEHVLKIKTIVDKLITAFHPPAESSVIHPATYRCPTLFCAISEGFKQLAAFNDAICGQCAALEHKKFHFPAVRQLFNFLTQIKPIFPVLKTLIADILATKMELFCFYCEAEQDSITGAIPENWNELIDNAQIGVESLQEILARYCYLDTVKQLHHYNYYTSYIAEVINGISEYVTVNWSNICSLPIDSFISLFTQKDGITPGIVTVIKQIEDIEINGECHMEQAAECISKIIVKASEIADILTIYFPNSAIFNVYKPLATDEMTYATAVQTFANTLSSHQDLYAALHGLMQNTYEKRLTAPSDFLAKIKGLSETFADVSESILGAYDKWKEGFFCEKFAVCRECDTCLPCCRDDCLCAENRGIRVVLWQLKDMYQKLADEFLEISTRIGEDCCLSSFTHLFQAQEQLAAAQMFIGEILNHEAQNNSGLIINIADIITKNINKITTDLITLEDARNHVPQTEEYCRIKYINEQIITLAQTLQVFKDDCEELLINTSIPKPSLQQQEPFDFSCQEFPWFLNKISYIIDDLSLSFETAAPTIACSLQNFEQTSIALNALILSCQNIYNTLITFILPADKELLCANCVKKDFNASMQNIANAILRLIRSCIAVKNDALKEFCCHGLYTKLQKTAWIFNALSSIVENVNNISIQPADIIYGTHTSNILEISNSIELLNSLFVPLFSKYNSLPAASFEVFCQSSELISYIDSINEVLQNNIYLSAANFFAEFGIPPALPQEEDIKEAISYEQILSSICSSHANINTVLLNFVAKVSSIEINGSHSDTLTAISSIISALNNTSLNIQNFAQMMKEKSICYNRILFDFHFEEELIQGIYSGNNSIVNTFIKLLNIFSRSQGIKKANSVSAILEHLRKFTKAVEVMASLDDPAQLFEEQLVSIPFTDILTIWRQYTNNIAELLDSTQEAPPAASLLDEAFLGLAKETLEFALLFDHIPEDYWNGNDTPQYQNAAALYKTNLNSMREQITVLAEVFIWLRDEVAFVRPAFSEETYTQAIHISNNINGIYDSLLNIADDNVMYSGATFTALAEEVHFLKRKFDAIVSVLHRPPCDLKLISAINSLSSTIRLLADNITNDNDCTKEQYQVFIIKFLQSIVRLKQFTEELLAGDWHSCVSDQLAERLANTPFDEMLAATLERFIPGNPNDSANPDAQSPPPTTLSSAIDGLSLSIISLIKGVAKWAPNIHPTHELLDIKLSALPDFDTVDSEGNCIPLLPLYMFETDVNIATISSKLDDLQQIEEGCEICTHAKVIDSFRTLHSIIKHLLNNFTLLFYFIQTIDKQIFSADLLDLVGKMTTTEDGQNVINLLYRTKFDKHGLPIMDDRGKSLTEKDTFLQQTKIVSNFGSLLDRALFTLRY
jgi:hypothetical protein